MNQNNKKLNISVEWEKAKATFKEADVLLQAEMPEGALSRFYYAAFHATQALLLTQGLEAKSHKAVGRLFSLHFVKTDKIDAKFSRILSHAQQDREEADYMSGFVFSVDDAEKRKKEVEEFLAIVESLLKSLNYLD